MIIKEDTILQDICCKGFESVVCVVFTGIDMIWGKCFNPNCPNQQGDPWQGVWDYHIEDLEEMTGMEIELFSETDEWLKQV